MSEAKKQHYIPQFILRNFIDRRGKILVLDKIRNPKKVFPTNPINVFAEKDLYTLISPSGEKDKRCETKYCELEKCARNAIELLRNNNTATISISFEHQQLLIEFVYRQYLRCPALHNRVFNFRSNDEALVHVLQLLQQDKRDVSREDKHRLQEPGVMQSIIQCGKVGSLWADGTALAQIRKMNLHVFKVTVPNNAFIIGSMPVIFGRAGSSWPKDGFASPQVQIWMPVAPDTALCLTNDCGQHTVYEDLTKKQIRRFNLCITAHSSFIAGTSERQLLSLANER